MSQWHMYRPGQYIDADELSSFPTQGWTLLERTYGMPQTAAQKAPGRTTLISRDELIEGVRRGSLKLMIWSIQPGNVVYEVTGVGVSYIFSMPQNWFEQQQSEKDEANFNRRK